MSVFRELPRELVKEIMTFVVREDWRTCNRPVAQMIEVLNRDVSGLLDYARFIWASSEEGYHEVNGWTLYGRKWLMNAHTDFVHAPRRPPLIPPRDGLYDDNYWKWYSHQIQWMNQ